MPALTTVRWEETVFKNLYDRVYSRTKIKMKGYVAVQKKLLIMIYVLWKKDVAFDPDFHKIISENEEVKHLFSTSFEEAAKKVGRKNLPTQDELPHNESAEALFLTLFYYHYL